MSESINITTPLELADAQRLLDEFAVSQAAELALSGYYASAESLLKGLIQRPDAPPGALDLLARICVQQGRVLEAGGLWRRALDKDAANSEYQAALVRLNRMQRRPLWLTVLWPAVLALAVIVFGFIALQIQSSRRRAELAHLEARINETSNAAAKSSDVGRLSQAVNDLKGQQRDLQGQIEQARRELKGLASTTARIAKTSRDLLDAWSRQNSSALAPDSTEVPTQGIQAAGSPLLRMGMQITGVVANHQGDHWVIRFKDGLFDQDDRFKAGSEALLKTLAKGLDQSQERIIIEIIGVAADEPSTFGDTRPTGRDVLSLARAETVERFLSSLGIFPEGVLRSTLARSTDFPFPDGADANRSINRSVLLRISRAQEPGK